MVERRKILLATSSAVMVAALSPTIYYEVKYFLQPYVQHFQDILNRILHFNIAGYYLPWRYILLLMFFGLIIVYIKIKRRRNNTNVEDVVNDAGPVLISGKTLLEIHNAKRNVEELSKRLDSAERTNRLVLKQMEAMTKCLAQVLQDGKFRENNNNRRASQETHI